MPLASLAGELGFGGEYLALRRSPLWRGREAPAGEGRAAVLVPGFGNPESAMQPLARWLRGGGWDVTVAPTGYNVDCGERVARHVDGAVSAARARSGRPVALIGHSRGGLISRAVAVRRADEVAILVTLATPWVVGMPDRPRAQRVGEVVKWANRHGATFLRSVHCSDGACCAALRRDVTRTPAAAWTVVWSRRDAIAGRLAVPPSEASRTVEIGTTHQGAMLSVPAWRAVGAALGTAP
jgi:pimeloyl-ACP methyl ester carboxylesterase